MKLLLQNNDTEMYSTYYAGKSAVAKRFSRTLKNKMYKYVTSVSKNVYIDKLDDIVNKQLCSNMEKIVGTFYKKEFEKIKNQKEFRIENVIQKKGDKLYAI